MDADLGFVGVSRFSATGKAFATPAATNFLSIRSTATQRAMIEEFYCYSEAATLWGNAALFLTTTVDTGGTAVALQKEDNGSGAPSVTMVFSPSGGTICR